MTLLRLTPSPSFRYPFPKLRSPYSVYPENYKHPARGMAQATFRIYNAPLKEWASASDRPRRSLPEVLFDACLDTRFSFFTKSTGPISNVVHWIEKLGIRIQPVVASDLLGIE